MPIKVLIIEDDFIIAENLKENLIELGYEVTGIAKDSKSAFTMYREQRPDICISDIYLKGSPKNGIEIMQQLNASAEIPIIYLTSFSDNEFREKAKLTSPSAFLMKPASRTQIDVAIDFALTNFRKKQWDNTSSEIESYPTFIRKDYFFIRVKDRYEKVITADISFIMAAGSYTKIYTSHKIFTISVGMKSFLEQLNVNGIARCHRSYAVNLNKIKAFDDMGLFVMHGKEIHQVPVSNQYKTSIQNLLPRIKTE